MSETAPQTEIQFLLDLILNQKFSAPLKQLMKDRLAGLEAKSTEQTEIQFLLDLLLNQKLNKAQKQLLTARVTIAEANVQKNVSKGKGNAPSGNLPVPTQAYQAPPMPGQTLAGTGRGNSLQVEKEYGNNCRGPRKW
jgi:hypothetical protein